MNKRSTVNQLKAGTILSYVIMAVSTIIPLLYTPIMLRMMSQEEYGLFGLSNSVISYLSLLTLGLGGTMLRFYMQHLTKGDHVMVEKTVGLFVVIFSVIAVVTAVVGFVLTFFTGSLFSQGLSAAEISKMNTLIIIMSINAAISLLSAPFSSVIVAHERYIFQKVFSLISTIASPILNLIALFMGFASVGLAVVGTIVCAISLLINIVYCVKALDTRPRFRELPFGILKEVFSFTLVIFVATIADLLYWSTDKLLIGALMSSVAVAVYNIGTTFNSVMQQMSSAISGVFAPRVNRMVFSEQPISDISELLIRIGRIQYLLLSLILSGFIVFGQYFILAWAGEGYEEAYAVALLTMIPMVIPLIQNIAFNAIVAMNKHKFRSNLYVILAVLNVISTYFLIPHMGIVGAALCTFVVFLLGHGLIMNWFYHKKIGLDIPGFWKNILKMTIIPGTMILAGIMVQKYVYAIDSLLEFALGVVAYTAIFCILSWMFTMNAYEKDLVKGLLRKILPKGNG